MTTTGHPSTEALQLVQVLERQCPCELISETLKTGQMRLLMRVKVETTDQWLTTMTALLRATRITEIGFDVSKAYLPQEDDTFKWAWRILLQHPTIQVAVPTLIEQLNLLTNALPEEREIPLNAPPNRNPRVVPTAGGA